jgi:membrane-associated phospholipid phosphatase
VASRARIPIQAAAACAGAFVALLFAAYTIPFVERVDATALSGLMDLRGPRAAPILEFFSRSADALPIAAMLAVIVALGFLAGRRRQAVAAAAVVGAATLTAEVLKVVLAHPRFAAGLGSHQLGGAAFPSGHATGAMALALAAVLVATPRLRPLAVAAGAAYAIAVSTSILVLGWHFPSDVFGGMLVSAFYFCTAVAALRVLAGREGVEAPTWRRIAAPRWREAALVAAVLGAAVAIARAGEVATYASAHTTATVIAIAIAASSAALLFAASVIADR